MKKTTWHKEIRALLPFIAGKEKVFHVTCIRKRNQPKQPNRRSETSADRETGNAHKNMEGIKTPSIARWQSKHLNSVDVLKIGRFSKDDKFV